MHQYDIERYLNVRNAGGADLGPDGRLSFLLNTTGTGQVWSLDEPLGWPEQHTFFEESVSFVDSSPERAEAVFGMDEGGNERAQLYLLNYESGEITDLTNRPEAKHRWGGWDSEGDRFAFASNRRDESVFDIYVQDRDATGGDAELVYEGDGWLSVAGWSPSDGRLIVHEASSSFDHDVYTLDLASGDLTHHTPHERDVRYGSPEGARGRRALPRHRSRQRHAPLRAARSRDRRVLRGCVRGRSGARERCGRRGRRGRRGRFPVKPGGDDGWNVDGVAIHEESRRVVYSRNVDGYTEITVGELVEPDRIDPFPTPDLPEGVAGGVSFGPDGDRFAITAAGSAHNANVYVVDTTTGETERWTAASTAGIPPDTFVDPELVHYPTFDGREIPAFFSPRQRSHLRTATPSSSTSTAGRSRSADPPSPRSSSTC